MAISIKPLSPFGAVVSGLDMSKPLTPDQLAELKSKLWAHHVLVFRGHDAPSDDQLSQFVQGFGSAPVLDAPTEMGPEGRDSFSSLVLRPDNPEIIMLTNKITENGRVVGYVGDGARGLGWHTDYCWADEVAEIGALDARIIPKSGSQTCFANMYAVYDALDPALKSTVGELVGVHELPQNVDHHVDGEGEPLRRAEHPLVVTNPYSGRRALYLNSLYTARIRGRGAQECAELFASLVEFSMSPQFIYEHDWIENDLVLWDQLGLIHSRKPFAESEPRYMRQISLVVSDKDAPWLTAINA